MGEGLRFDIDGEPEKPVRQSSTKFPLRDAILLFIVFIFVVSNIFVEHVLTAFDGAVSGRSPENFGIVIQGVSLVILYALSRHVADTMA